MPPIVIRPASIIHLCAVDRIFRDSLTQVPVETRRYSITRNRGIFVAIADGKVVGFSISWIKAPGTLWLDYFAVDPEVRNKGVGSLLLKHLEQTAAAESLRAIRLSVLKSNQAAIKLYTKWGYTIERSSTGEALSVTLPGQEPCYHLWKPVAPQRPPNHFERRNNPQAAKSSNTSGRSDFSNDSGPSGTRSFGAYSLRVPTHAVRILSASLALRAFNEAPAQPT